MGHEEALVPIVKFFLICYKKLLRRSLDHSPKVFMKTRKIHGLEEVPWSSGRKLSMKAINISRKAIKTHGLGRGVISKVKKKPEWHKDILLDNGWKCEDIHLVSDTDSAVFLFKEKIYPDIVIQYNIAQTVFWKITTVQESLGIPWNNKEYHITPAFKMCFLVCKIHHLANILLHLQNCWIINTITITQCILCRLNPVFFVNN